MDDQRQDDELEPTYNSSMPMQDVALKTCRKQWTIEKGRKKGSKISVLMARHDDDDDMCVYMILYVGLYCVLMAWILLTLSCYLSLSFLEIPQGSIQCLYRSD